MAVLRSADLMPSEPLLFPDEIEAIRGGLLAGDSYAALARKLDRDRSTVVRHARRLGLLGRDIRGRPTPGDPAVIRARLLAGDSLRQIAADLGCDSKTVWNIARRLGVRSRHKQFGERA